MMPRPKLFFFLSGTLAAIFLFLLILPLLNSQRIARGVTLAGENLGGLTPLAAQEKIARLTEQKEQQFIQFRHQTISWSVLPKDLGVVFLPEKTLEAALSVGRRDNLLTGLTKQVVSLILGEQINLAYALDYKKLADFIEKKFSNLENPAKNASLKYESATDDFIFLPAQSGEVFDRFDLIGQLEKNLLTFQTKSIALNQVVQKPILTQDKNNFAQIKAKRILSLAPYKLKQDSLFWPVEKQVLVDWLSFMPTDKNTEQTMDVGLSESSIKDFLSNLAPSINHEPIDASLTLQDQKVTAFALSQNGVELKIDESAQKISQEILRGQKKIELAVEETPPQISTQTIDTLGLNSLLAQGTSNFAGSPKNRIHNIGVGATKISGTLLKPDQEFSFLETIGEIGAEQGYLPELVIKNNKTIPEYGGGLCQISTTLFRAAVNAGLKITERYPHAFPVKYYNPQGFDATIYPPHPDLRFLNDTPAHILIQSKIEGTKITFEIYGSKDARETKVIGPTILESNPDGLMKTVLYQEIWRDGVLERKDTFRSNYRSPALYPVEKNPLE